MRRLVIAPNWIGDSVMSLPVLRALRRADPGGALSVLARRGPAAIYRAEGSATEVLPRSSSFLGDAVALRRGRFEEAWLLPNSYRAALLARASGARRRVGYATEGRGWLLTDAPPPPPGTIHQLRDYDALLVCRGIAPDEAPPRLPLPAAALERAAGALERAGVRLGAFAALCPGSAFARSKRWPAERFAGVADTLAARGAASAVLVGPGEEGLGAAVAGAARARPPVLGADLDPVELAAALSLARVAVTNDSGPMHLAGAVGVPVVAVFGPTDPGRTGPSGSPSQILDRYVFCSPCFKTDCPYGHECMKEIGVEDVVRAVEELISVERLPS